MANFENISRKQAEAKIALTKDINVIQSFSSHPNKHVKNYVEYKTGLLLGNGLAKFGQFFEPTPKSKPAPKSEPVIKAAPPKKARKPLTEEQRAKKRERDRRYRENKRKA